MIEAWDDLIRLHPDSALVTAAAAGGAAALPLAEADLELLSDLLGGEYSVVLKRALAEVGSGLADVEAPAAVARTLRSPRAADGLVRLLRWKRPDDAILPHLVRGVLTADELALWYYEELGRSRTGEERAFVRDLLCRRKLDVDFKTLTCLFKDAIHQVLGVLRETYLADANENYRPFLYARIREAEAVFDEERTVYLQQIEEELLNGESFDRYQMILTFIDRAYRRLPVDERPELDAFQDEELAEQFHQTVEALYTHLAGKLMALLIKTYADAAPVVDVDPVDD